MPLQDILGAIIDHPAVAGLAAAATGAARLRAAPLIGAARAPVVAALAGRGPSVWVYVVSNGDAALRAVDDLRQWLAPEQVLLYPSSDAMPYEHMSPGSEVLGQRLRVLAALAQAGSGKRGALERKAESAERWSEEQERSHVPTFPAPTLPRSPLVIVAPVKALLQPTLSPDELQYATTALRHGEEQPQDALIGRWVELGYRVAPTVEEPGELNRRGGIVDIWPMGDAQPLRVEWFGDDVDSLRRFDPLTQRSEQRIPAALVGPPHEFPLWNRSQALVALRSLDISGLRKEARDNWEAAIERLDAGEQFEGRPFFAPFYRAKGEGRVEQALDYELELCSLFAHLGAGVAVAFSEAALLAQTAAELAHQAEEQRHALVLANELPEAFPRPYLRWNEAIDQAHGPLVDLSNNEFEPEQGYQGDGPALPAAPAPPFSIFNSQFSIPASLFTPAELFGGQLKRLVGDILERLRAGERVAVISPQAARIQELVDEALEDKNEERGTRNEERDCATVEAADQAVAPSPSSLIAPRSSFVLEHGSLDAGFHSAELGLTLYTDAEIFGWRQRRPVAERRKRKGQSASDRAAFLRGLREGDYVVHIEHGIALYDGLLRRTINGVEREYLSLRYAAGDKLYVPVDQVDRVARYIGAGDATPQLTRLGTQEWERAKRKARSAVQDLAGDLLAIYAARQLHQGFAFSPDNEWQRELEASFPYVETDDQLRVLVDVKADMERPVPMDRLICGDVGFGKTEVALRAAFKAVQDGKQVAVLVPTTVLAQQHYDTFSRRMSAFPVKVEMLSRFRSAKEQDAILADALKGGVDILIGTHRLLSKDVHFKDLGLVVVDEEQRFGVRHKELLKRLRAEVDVLTLTATPIPRTLHMSLAGIRDLSVIDTPPEDRVPIKTYVVGSDDALIRESILREIDRGGQVYFVHNRVHSIYHVATHLKRLVPEAEIGVGHGQLDERQLEKVMFDFFSGKHDVLVCTTIIESGLDVPNANTIIIDDATHYGLAQLYQLRGRVGRSANRAYAYLLYKPDGTMTEEAQQRLQAIQEATELGAGFRIAMRDLEIRGAGNLLGAEQSGHIAAVGFDLYSRLLEQAVKDLKKQFEQGVELKLFEQQASARRKAAVSGDLEPVHDEQRITLDDLRPTSIKVDEKVLIAPLVTLDLPLTAFLPPEYIADDAVRLSVYQRMVEARTPQEVRALRQELRDRFGEPPEPAAHMLTWLLIKSLALQAGVSSVITTNEEFVVRLPNVSEAERDKLRRRFGRDAAVRVGPQFVRLDRRQLEGNWVPKLESVLEVLAS